MLVLPRPNAVSPGDGAKRAPLNIMCVRQVDLAFDHMPEAGSLPGQNHLDLKFSLSGQFLLTDHTFDGLLRGNTYLLEVFSHRHIKLFHDKPPGALPTIPTST